ncbi:hypothetical protein B0I37DRAFT_327480 [Chaetomium sp. MPI-CAGE-AT-0009]|nr:hypothetical protein B0I37DRAFT_327480 [Chaetomium sp. MPI-CAGE-AT-0009]
MSGFEVAGVVLGSIPIVITALEAYINFMKDWGKIPSELKSIHRQLTTERAKLYNVCDQLLVDVVPQRDIEPMLQDPMGPLWQAKEINEKIRRVLWNSYDPFAKTVLEIQDALGDIMERLRVQVTSNGQVEWVTKGRVTREFKKFLYRLNRKDYQGALTTISNGISDLEELGRLSVKLEPSRRKRSRGKVISILRDLSTSVYRALRSSILCSDPHDISLELRAQSIELGYDDEDEKVLHNTQFTFAVSFEAADGPARRRFWDEMNIRTVKRQCPAPTTSPYTVEKPKKNKKGVSFSITQTWSLISAPKPLADSQVMMSNLNHHASSITPLTPSNLDLGGPTSRLVDLCSTLRGSRELRPVCYGHLVDTEHLNRSFEVYSHGMVANSDSWSTVVLRDVLEHKDGLQPLATLREKISLSLAIASSVLQLSKTPWMPEVPTSMDVHFFKRGPLLSYQQPFLLKSFPEPSLPPQASHPRTDGGCDGRTIMVDRNPTLFALGIMLLEIMLGSTLDQLREPLERALAFDGDELGMIRDSVTAHRLLEQRVALISPPYQAVVERCIGCAAGQHLDEETFRQEVYNGVVMELEAIWEHTRLGV